LKKNWVLAVEKVAVDWRLLGAALGGLGVALVVLGR